MEERLQRLQELYRTVSGELEAWMKEDLQNEARPAAYSIDQAMMFMRSSFMWAQDAAAQVLHFNKHKAQMEGMDKQKPELKLEK